jgi:hypothetical protein
MHIRLQRIDAWKRTLSFESACAEGRVREMLILESYREGRLSRGQAAEMLGLGYHDAEEFFAHHGAVQQPGWDELEASGEKLRALLKE